MLRFIKLVLLIAIGLLLIMVAIANRQWVTLEFLPEPIGALIGFNLSISMPLFVVVFAGVILGVLVGYLFEYLREHKLRSAARKEHKQVVRLEREVDRLKAEKNNGKDDVLALIEN